MVGLIRDIESAIGTEVRGYTLTIRYICPKCRAKMRSDPCRPTVGGIFVKARLVLMAKQRDPVLDSMRGIGIVLMVLGHSGFPAPVLSIFPHGTVFMLSGWLFSLRGGLVHFAKRKVVTLWLPFVLANTAFTVLNNLFLRLNILTGDERILALPGNIVTTPTTLKDIIGRTAHWCVFDGGTQLGGALWFIQALFQISICTLSWNFAEEAAARR